MSRKWPGLSRQQRKLTALESHLKQYLQRVLNPVIKLAAPGEFPGSFFVLFDFSWSSDQVRKKIYPQDVSENSGNLLVTSSLQSCFLKISFDANREGSWQKFNRKSLRMRWQGIWTGTNIFFPSQVLCYIHGVPSCSRVRPGKGWELNRTNNDVLSTPHGNSATAWSSKVSLHPSPADSLEQGS